MLQINLEKQKQYFNQEMTWEEFTKKLHFTTRTKETVEEYKSGKTKVLGFLVGQVMKAMKGKANPGKVNEMMTEKLNA